MQGMDGMDGMDGMPTNGSSPASMAMQSVFQTIRATPLYSLSWTPNSTGAYAGTCIFLIFLAASLRGLLAAKVYLEQLWLDHELNRRYVVVQGGRGSLRERVSQDSESKKATVVLSENGVEEEVVVVGRRGRTVWPWRVSVDLPRACVDVVIAGVGYLLMLAVMTMNVGYFLSVLGGTFLGSLLVGRFTALPDH